MSVPLCIEKAMHGCSVENCGGARNNDVPDDIWKSFRKDGNVSSSTDNRLAYRCPTAMKTVLFDRCIDDETGICESIWKE